MNWYKKICLNELTEKAYKIFNLESLSNELIGYKIELHEHDNFNAMGCIDYKLKIIRINIPSHKNLSQLIDTIAHEISHIYIHGHNKIHTRAKMALKKIIKISIEYPEIVKERQLYV